MYRQKHPGPALGLFLGLYEVLNIKQEVCVKFVAFVESSLINFSYFRLHFLS